MTQIIGIMLVRNEDRFLARAARNVLPFCDRLLIADHGSQDATPEICAELARGSKKVTAHRIRDPRESQEMLAPFAGTATWVLGVDGDEIYDPAGLALVRADLQRGLWAEWWTVFGNVLNCAKLDEANGVARGWLAPPCRSMTKLYNFAAIDRLDVGAPQRLMGRGEQFRPGFDAGRRLEIYKTLAWEEARFRCLHACFLPRSSRDENAATGRENITERRRHSLLGWARRGWARLRGRAAPSHYKLEKYRRGPLVEVDAVPFFPPDAADVVE